MKIAMLLSGGVDSSVALTLLKEQGHDITAYYLKIWLEDELSYLGSCPWEEDLSYAEKVCAQLDVPLKVVPLQKEYHARVVSYTIDAVKKGHTPNPDMQCNAQVKFGAFLEQHGEEYDKIATGHYAQVGTRDESGPVRNASHSDAGGEVTHQNLTSEKLGGQGDERGQESIESGELGGETGQGDETGRGEQRGASDIILRQAPDAVKDQTYFLAMMSREQLRKALFPIGHLEKTEVRALAEKYDLPTAKRKDSQGICFLGKISFTDFIRHHLGVTPGTFVEKETGKEIGTHEGYYFYTIGQRRGVEVNGGPWYVCGKDVAENIVYLTHGFIGEDQSREMFTAAEMNWITDVSDDTIPTKVKLRHGPAFHSCILEFHDDNTIDVTLTEGDRSVTPGQYAVFYTEDNQCMGGGVIL